MKPKIVITINNGDITGVESNVELEYVILACSEVAPRLSEILSQDLLSENLNLENIQL